MKYRNVDFADSCTFDADKGFGVCDSCKFHSEGDKCDSCVTNYYVNPVVSNPNLTYPDGEQCQGENLITNLRNNAMSVFPVFRLFCHKQLLRVTLVN